MLCYVDMPLLQVAFADAMLRWRADGRKTTADPNVPGSAAQEAASEKAKNNAEQESQPNAADDSKTSKGEFEHCRYFWVNIQQVTQNTLM